MKPNSQIFWRNDSLVSMKWSWRTCKQGRCRDFSKDTAPPPPRLQVESLPFKTIQKLFWWKYSLVKSWDFFPRLPLQNVTIFSRGKGWCSTSDFFKIISNHIWNIKLIHLQYFTRRLTHACVYQCMYTRMHVPLRVLVCVPSYPGLPQGEL